jgi:hypothetical protein
MATGEALGCGMIQGWAARAEEGKTWRRVAAPAPRPAGEPVEARPGVVADSATVGEARKEKP